MAVRHDIDPAQLAELSKEQTVVVDFWAPWCGPCRAFGPVFEKVAQDHPEALFAKVNVDSFPDFSAANAIQSIPTLWVLKAGEVAQKTTGSMTPAQLEELL